MFHAAEDSLKLLILESSTSQVLELSPCTTRPILCSTVECRVLCVLDKDSNQLSTKITFILVKGTKVMQRLWKPLRLAKAKEGEKAEAGRTG